MQRFVFRISHVESFGNIHWQLRKVVWLTRHARKLVSSIKLYSCERAHFSSQAFDTTIFFLCLSGSKGIYFFFFLVCSKVICQINSGYFFFANAILKIGLIIKKSLKKLESLVKSGLYSFLYFSNSILLMINLWSFLFFFFFFNAIVFQLAVFNIFTRNNSVSIEMYTIDGLDSV